MPSISDTFEVKKPSVVCSIIAAQDLINFIATTYNISVLDCQLIKPLVSATYLVSTPGKKYVLRIYPAHQSKSFIVSELDAILLLHKEGINVAVPQPIANGGYSTSLLSPEGERQAVLFSFAEGKALSRVTDENYFIKFGRLVGSLHACSDRHSITLARPFLGKSVLIEESLEYISKLYSHHTDELRYLSKVSDTIRSKFDGLSAKNLNYGLCHGDLNSFNVHVDQSGKLTLFDFEYCGIGWHSYDLATFINTETRDHVDLFLQGYQDIRHFTENEKHSMPIFQIAQKIWMLGEGAKVMHTMGTFMFTEGLLKSTLNSIQEKMTMLE